MKYKKNFLSNFNKKILNAVPDEISLIEPKERKIIFMNSVIVKKYKNKKIIGNNCFNSFHGINSICNECPIPKTLKTNKASQAICINEQNGVKKYSSVTTIPIIDEDTNKKYILHTLRDVTKRKNAENNLKGMNAKIISLFSNSFKLQSLKHISEIVDIAIQSFISIGYDRVKIYRLENDELIGIKSSFLSDKKFKNKKYNLSKKYPKKYETVKSKKPMILKDLIKKYPKDINYDLKELSASLPIINDEKIIGVISIDNKFSKKPIIREDLSFLMIFVNQIAGAINNSLLYKENLKKYKTLSTLYDVSNTLSGTLDLDKILNLIVIKIVKIIKCDICSILLLDDSKKNLIPKIVYDLKGEYKLNKDLKIEDTISGEAIKSLKYKYVSDILSVTTLLSKSYIKKEKIKTLLSLPLKHENTPIGVINIFTKKDRVYTKEEIDLLNSLSHQVSLIIENSKLYETIKEDKENLSGLVETSQVLNSTLDTDKLQEIILNKTLEYTNAEFGFLMLIKDDYLKVKLSSGFDKKRTNKIKIKIGEGISGHVAKTGKPYIVHDVTKDKKYIPVSDDIKSEAVIPLITQNKVIGVLSLESTKVANFKRFQKSLNILTNQIAISIENTSFYNKIKNFNNRLKSEIELATKELREKNIELKKMDQMKSDFVSNVSHELRTPLTSISGYTKLLLMEKLGSVNDQQKDCLNIVAEESERLTRLINNVLDLSKLESGKIKFKLEKITIKEIATSTIQTLIHVANDKNITIKLKSIGKTPDFKASKDLVKQVFINLLNNALKFTPEDGKISVTIKHQKTTNMIDIAIKDSGDGIEKELIPRLFDKFYQVDSSMTRAYGGTGLGLVIVKHIIDAHKGKIKVKSKIGEGSEFVFSLPFRK
jgi:signal transduction histidine kinase